MTFSKSENVQLLGLTATIFFAAFLNQGCTTINIIFTGSDSGPSMMPMADAGVLPMGDGGSMIGDDAAMSLVDAGSDAGTVVEVDAGPPDAPTLVVNADNLRQSTILVAGGGIWHNVAQYRVTPSVDSTLQCVRVQIDGDAADIEQFAIAQDGVIMGLGILPSGTDTSTIACLSTPIVMGPDLRTYFQIWVRIPAVVSGASVGGVFDGVPRSGDRFRMGIDYIDFLATGASPATFPMIWGNEFQIRKTRPTVTRQTLSTTILANGTSQDLYRFQVSADAAGSVSLHSIAFNALASGGLTFSGFGLRRGSTLMDTAEYNIVDEYANDLEAGSLAFADDESHRIVIVFHDDGENVTGSGNVYTLQATPSGVDVGDTFSLAFHRTLTGSTGYLLDDPIHSALDISSWGAPETGSVIAAGFIWSDLSEVPHSDFYGCCGGSRDWTDGYLIEDLNQTQTLTR